MLSSHYSQSQFTKRKAFHDLHPPVSRVRTYPSSIGALGDTFLYCNLIPLGHMYLGHCCCLLEAAALAEEAAEAAEPESAEPAAASAEVSVTSLELGSASGSEEEPGQEQDRSSGQT
ncbi:hypothetical protein ILYODFUR_026233 [Ilyodon furcidens]|uniref:Uncharacterized protein n=1 Tax=Ilyodon furcidens TaxID=33524 RepID=A0ABV0UKL5_9TELE